jgi:hypothetical protein
MENEGKGGQGNGGDGRGRREKGRGGRERGGVRGGQGGEWRKELLRITFECLPPRLRPNYNAKDYAQREPNALHPLSAFLPRLVATGFFFNKQ